MKTFFSPVVAFLARICDSRRFAFAARLTGAVFCGLFALSPSVHAQSYVQWLTAHGLPAEVSGDGALNASPAGDGIPNLMKFGLGLSPREPGYSGRLTTGTMLVDGASHLTLQFTRPAPAPSGISYVFEASSTVGDWIADGIELQNTSTGGLQTIVMRDAKAYGTVADPRRFVRLNVSVTATAPELVTAPQISGSPFPGSVLTATQGVWNSGGDDPIFRYQWTRNGEPISGAQSPTYQVTDADLGATLAVRIEAVNIAGVSQGVAASVGPVRLPFPQISIRADGYTAELRFGNLTTGGNYSLTPDTNPKVLLTITSPGFDSEGRPTTLTREVFGTVPLRQPFPNQNTNTESAISGGVQVTIALSDRIYAGDVVTNAILLPGAYTSGGVPSPSASLSATSGETSNRSTLGLPKPIANWLAFPRERATAGSTHFPIELLAFHRHPRDGRQVACVEFIASDEQGNSVSVKSSTMERSQRVTTGNPIAVYRAEIPLATLAQGDLITVRTKVYPFLGDAASVLDSDPSVDGAPASVPSGFANYQFLNDKTGAYGTVYATVSPTGSDNTGVASDVAATAADRPFLTITAAATAVRARNLALYGRNDLGGGVVRLAAGTYAGFGATSLNALGAGRTWFTIEAAPGEGPDTVILQPGTQKNPGNWVMFRNLTMQATSASGAAATVIDAVVDGSVDGPPVIYGAYEGLRIRGMLGSAPIIYRVGLRHFIGCEMTDIGPSLNGPYSTTREHTPLLAGCRLSFSTQRTTGGLATPSWTSVGNILSGGFHFTDPASTAGTAPNSTRVVAPKASIVAFNSVFGSVASSAFGFRQPTPPGGGLALVQNVMELIINTSSPTLSMAADSAIQPLDNILLQHLTVVGARTNYLYNDIGTVAIPKNGTLAFSVLQQYNCKTDTFAHPTSGQNGARTGNWEVHHGVGQIGNVYRVRAANNPASPFTGPSSWNGMYLGINVRVAGDPAFREDRSLTGSNVGSGNYRLGTASDARNRVPAGLATLPFDLDGNLRRNDGTGAAGAYEF